MTSKQQLYDNQLLIKLSLYFHIQSKNIDKTDRQKKIKYLSFLS